MSAEEQPDGNEADQSKQDFGWSATRKRLAGNAGDAPNPPRGAGRAPRKLRPSRHDDNERAWGLAKEEPASAPPAPATDEVPAQAEAEREKPQPRADTPAGPSGRRPGGRAGSGAQQNEAAKTRLHELLIEELEHGALDGLAPDKQREAVLRAARELLSQEDIQLAGTVRDELIESVADEVLGLGPLEPLLRDPSVSEVMVNDVDKIYYEQDGRLFRSPARFRDIGHVMRIVERIVAPLGRRIDEASPMVDARLPDGSRVNITIPPISPFSPFSPSITIRKFRADKMRIADLVAVGSMSEATAEFLAMCVRAKLNIIVSGGTGTGKTTLLNALSGFIPNTERIVTIEDPSELRLQQEHVLTMEARPPSIEGKNAVLQRDLVRNSLRMRPDRIIVGEVRGSEAFDMLQAMNTGHEGSISTIHANTPRDAVARLENMVLMAGMELPARAIREQVASAIEVFIQIQRMQDGTRKVTHVTEVSGMEGETITLQDIFRFHLDEVTADGRVVGDLRASGIRPGFVEKFLLAGITLPDGMFDEGKDW